MEEEIQEYLEDNFEFLKFDIKYVKIKTYKITIDLYIKDNKILRTDFEYVWEQHSTTNANLSNIKYYVEKSIKIMFRKEVK